MTLSANAQTEYLRLQQDPVYFYEKFLATEEEPEPFDYQKAVLRAIANPEYKEIDILKGRQIGMSWTMGVAACWYASMHEGRKILTVAFNLEQAQLILNYAKTFMSRLKKKNLYDFFIESSAMKHMTWRNGSQLLSLGCTVPDAYNIRGQTAHLLFVDEAAIIYDRMFPSITPTVANTGGTAVFLGTAGSIGSTFYRKWSEGEKINELRKRGETNLAQIKSFTLPSTLCPNLTPEMLEKEKRTLGEIRYNREYLCVWVGTAEQVFIKIPVFDERLMPTKTIRPCFGGIDVGRVSDPTVLIIVETYLSDMYKIIDGKKTPVHVPYRVIYGKSWERNTQAEIAADIMHNIHPRFPCRLYQIDITGGYGDELMHRLVDYELPCRGADVKSKLKNEMMLGSPAQMGLSNAFLEEQLFINNNIDDIIATELLFELNAYSGKVLASGLYIFDSVIDRVHMVDALAHAWSAVQAGSFNTFIEKRKRKG